MTAYVGFLVLCTVLDFTEPNDGHKSDKYHILAKFSLWKNAKKLFSTKVQDNSLPFLHGMRVLSTAWIVLFHEYFFQFFMVNANLVYIPEVKKFAKKLLIFLKSLIIRSGSRHGGF